MNKIKFMVIAMGLPALTAFSASLVSVDFESDAIGLPPTASNVSPVSNAPLNSNAVVGASINTAGTGNGLRITDMNIGAGNRVDYDLDGLQAVSALRFDFNTASKTNYGGTGDYISACVVNSQTSTGASANRYAEIRLLANGHARFYSVGSYISNSDIGLDLDTAYKFSMFVNDSDEEIVNYSGARSLAPNTVDYWINDSYYISGDLNTVSAGTTNGLGRVGFATSTTDLDLDWVFDNVTASNVVAGPPVDYLLSEDYEIGQTVGQQPNGAMNVRPSPNNATAFVQIVDDAANTAGTGNAVQMFDNATANSSTDITCMEYHFVADALSQISALRADFSFAPLSTTGAGDKFIAVGIGEFNTSRTFQTKANRYIDARLYNDGTIDFRNADTNAPSSEGNALLASGNTLSIYANDYDVDAIDYTGLNGDNYTLPANSVAFWLNGDLVLMDGGEEHTTLDLDDKTNGGADTVGTSEDNFGKFGFSTGTSEYDLSYVLDDIYITTNILVRIDSYQEWLDLYPELGSSTNYMDDVEPDGMNNLLEYALGGNPTAADATQYLPVYNFDEGAGYLNYIYNRRVNADDLGLTYDVVSGADLGAGLGAPTEEAGSTAGESGFDVVTNRVSVAAAPVAFMQLNVEVD